MCEFNLRNCAGIKILPLDLSTYLPSDEPELCRWQFVNDRVYDARRWGISQTAAHPKVRRERKRWKEKETERTKNGEWERRQGREDLELFIFMAIKFSSRLHYVKHGNRICSSVLNRYKRVFIIFSWTMKSDPSGAHVCVSTGLATPRYPSHSRSESIVRPIWSSGNTKVEIPCILRLFIRLFLNHINLKIWKIINIILRSSRDYSSE